MAEHTSDVSAARPDDLQTGQRLGRYRIDGIVGRGGMGTVYRAFDEETQREVAIKVLLPGLPEVLKERFLAECEAEAKIRHPHVMHVYDRGRFDSDRLYFVMELVYEPITLSDVVDANAKGLLSKRWPRLRQWSSPKRLLQDVLVPIAEGVDASNREFSILHRDLKPDNVLIDVRTRRPTLIDFGICHERGAQVQESKLIGTPRFLSPEQAYGRIDDRTDVWGLGALVYYVFAGQPPIEASSPMRREERKQRIAGLRKDADKARADGDEVRASELDARRAALEDPSLRTVDDMIRDAREGRYSPLPESTPAGIRAIIRKAMAKEPADRYAHGAEVAADLRAWIAGERVQALKEQAAGQAAVVAAQRTVRRHMVTALWVVLGLAIGLPLGARFLSGDDATSLAHTAEARRTVDDLADDVKAFEAASPTSIATALTWRALRDRIEDARQQAAPLEDEDERAALEKTLAELTERTAAPVLVVAGGGARWKLRDLLTRAVEGWEGERRVCAPGLYAFETKRARVPFQVPATPAAEVQVDLSHVPADVPRGMVFVPAGAPGPGGETGPAFLVGIAEVTHIEYSEWLDELEDAERAQRLPTEGDGFQPDPDIPGRYLVDADWEDRPVTGVRPSDAAAYAAWRSEVDGAPVRLPSIDEWRRAAGGGLMAPAWATLFRPLAVAADGRVTPERGPSGAEALLTAPPEIVRADTGWVLVGLTKGLGLPPAQASLERTEPAEADAPVTAGFRLMQPLP